jgi:photosystem II stability/assembly factor-like uncharacterized protein
MRSSRIARQVACLGALWLASAALLACGRPHAARPSWTALDLASDAEFEDVYFADSLNGWVVGGGYQIQGGIVGRTQDGGVSWRFTSGLASEWPGVSSFSLTAVRFLDGARGLATASGGQIFLTADGGDNWRAVRFGQGDGLTALDFLDSSTGWAAGPGGVFRTDDSGENWRQVYRSTSESGYLWGSAIHFVDVEHGWMAGQLGMIASTSDGGETWTPVTTPLGPEEKPHLFAMHFPDARHGWVVGENGTILHTADGGATWVRQSHGVPGPTVPRRTARNAREQMIEDLGIDPHGLQLSLMSVYFVDAERGWVVGNYPTEGRAIVLRTVDGGENWSVDGGLAGYDLRAVFFSDRGHGWAVGDRTREVPQAMLRYAVSAR